MKAAENLGADIVINSTHKTLASLTQSAVVHLCTDRVDKYEFEDKLQMIESTSPSYLLMASLDINADLLEKKGEKLFGAWEDNLQYFYERSNEIPGLRVMRHPFLDHTKINLDMSAYGLSGLDLEDLLMERNIFAELTTGNILMCMTGIGNKRYDYERLLAALQEIAEERPLIRGGDCKEIVAASRGAWDFQKLTQRPIPKEKERIPLETACGRVCAASVIPYPPGIPILCPGEIMEKSALDYVKALREAGEKVMGIDDLGRVTVGKE